MTENQTPKRNCESCKKRRPTICWLCSDKLKGLALKAGESTAKQVQRETAKEVIEELYANLEDFENEAHQIILTKEQLASIVERIRARFLSDKKVSK